MKGQADNDVSGRPDYSHSSSPGEKDGIAAAGLVKSLVGHSEDMDTFGVYGHELNGDAQQQANALNSVFSRLLAQC